MRSKSIKEGPHRTFVLILDQGEEAFKTITDFANREGIEAHRLPLSARSPKRRSAGLISLQDTEQCEVLSLMGDVAQGDDGKASIHLHTVLGPQDGSLKGGHFLSGHGSADAGGDDRRNGRASAAPEAC